MVLYFHMCQKKVRHGYEYGLEPHWLPDLPLKLVVWSRVGYLTSLSLSFIYEQGDNSIHLIEMLRELNELTYVMFRRVMVYNVC